MSERGVIANDFDVPFLAIVSPIRRVVTLFERGWLSERVFGARGSPLLVRRSRAINATILRDVSFGIGRVS